jgi:hypothetical protein
MKIMEEAMDLSQDRQLLECNSLTKVAYFSKIYHSTELHDTTVTPVTLHVYKAPMLEYQLVTVKMW